HAGDGAIEGARAEAERAVGAGLHVLDDGVAVLRFAAQGDQDVEGGGRQGEQRGDGVGWAHASKYIHPGYIVNGYICRATLFRDPASYLAYAFERLTVVSRTRTPAPSATYPIHRGTRCSSRTLAWKTPTSIAALLVL